MPQWMLTLGIAFFLIFIAILSLGIGWLITGKTKMRTGMCGRDPNKPKENCEPEDSGCSLCETKDEGKKNCGKR